MKRSEINKIYDEMKDAVKAVADKYSLQSSQFKLTYSDSDLLFKIHLDIIADNGNKVITKAAQSKAAFALAKTNAATDEPLGKTYDFERIGIATIVDYNSRCYKYPFIVKTKTGKMYKVSVNSVAKASRFGDIGLNH